MTIPLDTQIREVDAEIARRKREFPRLVSSGKMRQPEAELLIDRMQAVRETLVFVSHHEAEFRSFVAARKAAKP